MLFDPVSVRGIDLPVVPQGRRSQGRAGFTETKIHRPDIYRRVTCPLIQVEGLCLRHEKNCPLRHVPMNSLTKDLHAAVPAPTNKSQGLFVSTWYAIFPSRGNKPGPFQMSPRQSHGNRKTTESLQRSATFLFKRLPLSERPGGSK